ncbi:MATE family efflux transporter [Acidaminobacter sp. JC074]|nr:MATE family efflux transporter [Acidaminobacter sp. JC074]
MSLPTMAGFFAQTLYDVVDMMWIGRISLEALAGVTIFATIFWLVGVLNEIIGSSSISMISQSYGEGDKEKTSRIIEQTITFKALVAVLAGIILMVIIKPLAIFFDSNPRVVQSVMSYGYIRIFFIPIMFSSYTVNTALRCIGDSKKPFYLMLISSVLNIVLDPIFIFDTLPIKFGFIDFTIKGFGLGVFGAALATVISITIAFVIGFYFLISGKSYIKISFKGLFRLDKDIDYKLITIGLPNGVESLNRNLSNFVVMKFIGHYGSVAIAASGIGMRFMGILFMPLIGLMMGGGAIVGQNLGINQVDRAKETAKSAAQLGVAVIALVSVLTFIFDEQIMRMFTNVEEVISIGVPMLKVFVVGMFLLAILFGYSTVFSGSGYNFPFLVSSVAGRWLAAIPFAFVAIFLLDLDIIWLWISYIVGDIMELGVIMYYYIKGDWQTKKVI